MSANFHKCERCFSYISVDYTTDNGDTTTGLKVDIIEVFAFDLLCIFLLYNPFLYSNHWIVA